MREPGGYGRMWVRPNGGGYLKFDVAVGPRVLGRTSWRSGFVDMYKYNIHPEDCCLKQHIKPGLCGKPIIWGLTIPSDYSADSGTLLGEG
jgi:hypothetical protein